MSAEKAPSVAESQESTALNKEQLHAVDVSKRNFKRLNISENDLNNYAKKLDIKATINVKDNKSIYDFVHELQTKIIVNPVIKESFKGRLNLLSDDKFGPVTLRSIYIVLSRIETENLTTSLDGILNKPVKKEEPSPSTEVQTKPTPQALLTYQSPEKNPQWELSRYYRPGKDRVPTNTSTNVKSGESLWTIGSSSAYNEQNHTGFGSIGAIGTNPDSFYKVLTQVIWPDIVQRGVTPAAKVVLLGFGTNGLTSSQNPNKIDESIKRVLAGYQRIADFLKSKGVGIVKIATLNPYDKKIAAISKFNEIIKQNPDLCVDTNRVISTPDGKSFLPGYNSDKLHLTPKGHKAFATVIQDEARKQKSPQA